MTWASWVREMELPRWCLVRAGVVTPDWFLTWEQGMERPRIEKYVDYSGRFYAAQTWLVWMFRGDQAPAGDRTQRHLY